MSVAKTLEGRVCIQRLLPNAMSWKQRTRAILTEKVSYRSDTPYRRGSIAALRRKAHQFRWNDRWCGRVAVQGLRTLDLCSESTGTENGDFHSVVVVCGGESFSFVIAISSTSPFMLAERNYSSQVREGASCDIRFWFEIGRRIRDLQKGCTCCL